MVNMGFNKDRLDFYFAACLVCMCWNLGHPLWLCVSEADQSIYGGGASSHMGMFVCRHAQTGFYLPLSLCVRIEREGEGQRASTLCGCLEMFPLYKHSTAY